jgi:hypothetical protein
MNGVCRHNYDDRCVCMNILMWARRHGSVVHLGCVWVQVVKISEKELHSIM